MNDPSHETDVLEQAAADELAPEQSVSIKSRDDLAREIAGSIQRNPNVFGAADIFNLDYQKPSNRAAILITALMGIVDGEGRSAVTRYVVVTPPDRPDITLEAIWSDIVEVFPLLAGWKLEAQHEAFFKRKISVVPTRDLGIGAVLDILAGQPEQAAVIVTEAASFRDEDVGPFIAPPAETPLIPEDVWAPHVHALASKSIAIARERVLYVALDTDRMSPRREELRSLLEAVDGCGVVGSDSAEDPETILAARIDEWDAWLRQGRLGPVLQEIDALPAKMEINKRYLRIQVMFKAGLAAQALEMIRAETAEERDIDRGSRVKLARMAQEANADRLAAEILAPAAGELDNREDLESALGTASRIGESALEAALAARLEALFPASPGVRRHKVRGALDRREFEAAADLFAGEDPASERFYRAIAAAFASTEIPDYLALIASAGDDQDLADAYRMASVSDALHRKLSSDALDLAIPLPQSAAQVERGISLLVQTLEALFIGRAADGSLAVADERIEDAVLAVIDALGEDSGRQHARVRLVQLLQPSTSGFGGQALIATLVLRLAARPMRLHKAPVTPGAGLGWIREREEFVKRAFEWFASEQPVVIGRSTFPAELLTESADAMVSSIGDYFALLPPGGKDEDDIILRWLALGAAIAPHCLEPDQDLVLIRLAASRLASSGRGQLARDLVEQALQSSNGSPRRRRLGWFAMADVYSRLHNDIEALVAMAAALAADDSAEEGEAWHQVTTVARIFRDLRLFDHAREACNTARRLLERMGLADQYGYRIDTLELQTRQMEWLTFRGSKAELEVILEDAVRNAADNLGHNDMAAPVALMLGQLLVKAEAVGAKISRDARDLFEKLRERSGAAIQPMLDLMSTDDASVENLLKLVVSSDSARYSNDAGFDARNLSIAAGRVLANPAYASDAIATSFALELLADRGVATPGWDNAAEPPQAPVAIDEAAGIAKCISLDGVSVVQAGFDAHGRLVRVSAVEGEMEPPVREPADVMEEERLRRWSRSYPYAYGIDEDSANLFYTTTQDLRFSSLPPGPVILAADTSLQVFPPNLLFTGEEFAGRDRPIAATPSLSWLRAARAQGPVGDGRHCAWISSADSNGHTLQMITGRLENTFDVHGFSFDTGADLPGNFAGATMAVIAAHGSIHPDGRYFQVVSDEGSLRVSTSDMANALRNIDVVVLFVCSGGRTDLYPGANTTIGLAKQILDRGCNAVIGSPWPLDSSVPAHWLPPFLDHWASGATAMAATFEANKVVDKAFRLDPARGLAMTVFGNPLVRKPRTLRFV